MNTTIVRPVRRRREFSYTEADLQALASLTYKTPTLKRLLAEPDDNTDPFRPFIRDQAIPKARHFDRIMRTYAGNPVGVEFRHEDRDVWAFVVSDASENGRWRIQLFDRKGFISHRTRDTMQQAVLEMVDDRHVEDDPGRLDHLAATEDWRLGTEVAALLFLLNTGQISFDEFLRREAAARLPKAA